MSANKIEKKFGKFKFDTYFTEGFEHDLDEFLAKDVPLEKRVPFDYLEFLEEYGKYYYS